MTGSTSEDRINAALTTLKNELLEMRNQDVNLMKQLIGLNSSLEEINKERRLSLSRSSSKSSVSSLQWKRISESLKSAAVFCNSLEYSSDSDSEIAQTTRTMPSVAMILPENQDVGDSYYRNILTTNVKLWKMSLSDDSDEDI